jgi:chitodextrinase
MNICHCQNRSIQLFWVLHKRLTFIRALLKKNLFLARCFPLIVLIIANILLLNGCKPPSATHSTIRDKHPPTTPTNLTTAATSPARIYVDWEASTDNERVSGYRIYRDGLYISSNSYGGSSFSDSRLNPDTRYCYTVSAYDDSRNESAQSQQSCATTPPDLTPPTPPAKLTARAVSSDQIDLKWTASVDDVIVSGYKIFRDGSLIQNLTETGFSDTGLNPETTYCYTVSAYDKAGNESGSSNQACAVSSWIITAIDHLNLEAWPAIAIDSSDSAHLVYAVSIYNMDTHRYVFGDLNYATNTPESWNFETIGKPGRKASVALDSADMAHISFLYGNRLNYATNASGVWLTESLDPYAYVYSHSIAVDSTGNVHISYDTSIGLKYVTNVSGEWTDEILESSGRIGSNSIAVDLYDRVHISFIEVATVNGDLNGNLKYITNAQGTWVTETVDSQQDTGYYNSIAVDPAGNGYISYYDSTNKDLKTATNGADIWVTETVDSRGDVGKYSSIAIDAAGNAHISYYDSTNESLNYTTNASGEWGGYILENWSKIAGDQGSSSGYGFSSIALDSGDKVHIVYDWMHDVRYITNR